MNRTNMDQLIDCWLRCVNEETDTPVKEDNFWAYEQVQKYLLDDPARAWEFIQSVARRDLSEKLELIFACGPLEDFVHGHAAQYIDQIEEFATTTPKLAELLGGVWYRDTVPSDVWKRIEDLRGEPWGP